MDISENTNENEKQQNFSILAAAKIATELASFRGGHKETTVSKFVASTLTHFCEESERFAEVVYKTPRTLSDCCAEIMNGCGNQVSDIDVYRGAVQSYFPNADIFFKMEIQINGDAPSDTELMRPPKTIIPEQRRNNVASKHNSTATEMKNKETIQVSLFD